MAISTVYRVFTEFLPSFYRVFTEFLWQMTCHLVATKKNSVKSDPTRPPSEEYTNSLAVYLVLPSFT